METLLKEYTQNTGRSGAGRRGRGGGGAPGEGPRTRRACRRAARGSVCPPRGAALSAGRTGGGEAGPDGPPGLYDTL